MSELHLLYHELRQEESAYSYVVQADLFREHCALFARAHAQQRTFRPVVTFDDGHRSDRALAAPILEEHGLQGQFFVTAGWSGVTPGYMSPSELRELHAKGHLIGAHGMTHKLLTRCTPEELEEELAHAKERLEDMLGARVTTMSLPGGRANARVLRACAGAGYEQVFTSIPEAAELKRRPFTVGRVNLQGNTTTEWLQRLLDQDSGLLAKLSTSYKLKSLAKQCLGDRFYARLWSLLNRHDGTERSLEEASTR